MEVTISKIEQKDIQRIAELFRIYEKELGVSLCFQGFEEELVNLPGVYTEPKGCILKAEINSVIIGCVALKPLEDHICEMKRLFVLKEYKGNRIGIDLAERIILEARQKGYETMKLDTLERLRPAVNLYTKLGFKLTKPYNHNPESDILYFEKALQLENQN